METYKKLISCATDKPLEKNEALKAAFRDALAVQNACNLSGILESLYRHLPAIRVATGNTDAFNRHPVIRLFAEQIAHLSGMNICGDLETYDAAYKAALAATTP